MTSYTKGAVYSRTVTPMERPSVPAPEPGHVLGEYTDDYLRRCLDLCRERKIPVLLLYVPSCLDQAAYLDVFAAADYAAEYGVPFLNLMDHVDEMGLDFATDYRDAYHLNADGAAKATAYLGRWLERNLDIDRSHSAELTTKWDADLEAYHNWIED